MESGDQQDKWAALNESLGIEPTAAPETEHSAPPAEVPAQPAIEHRAPTRPPSAWGDLAEEFGLEVEEPEAPPAVEAEPEKAAEPVAESKGAEVEAESPSDTEEKASQEDASEVDAPEDDAPEDESPEVAVVEQLKEDTDLVAETAVAAEEPEVQEAAAREQQQEEAPMPAAPSGFGGTGLTLPDWFPFGGRKKATPPPEPTVEAEESEVAEAEPVADIDSESQAEDQAEDQAKESSEEKEGEGEGERRRGRRRRGRRRGRGRKRISGEASDEADEADESDESSAEDEDFVATGGVDDEDSSDETPEKRVRTVSHKNIPPWHEAIGVVVDANIAARGERKRSSRSRGGSRGGRGRRRSGGGKKES